MSKPKRYTPDYTFTGTAFVPTTREVSDGEYVRYEDYARLADEVTLMNQLFDKYLTPEMRKAIVKVVRSKYPR